VFGTVANRGLLSDLSFSCYHTFAFFATDRALRLTGLCLKLNPANYTIWHFRRQCLEQIMQESEVNRTQLIRDDLHLAETLGGANPKNYQIWYHRRALLERAATVSPEGMTDAVVTQELAYVAKVLDEDSKNYHAWSHRQWIMRTANKADLWERELEFGRWYFLVLGVCICSWASLLFRSTKSFFET